MIASHSKLVKANLAYDRLEDFIHAFIGDSEIGGNMQEISRIFDILISITPLYDPEKQYEETELCKLMESDLSPEEKADKIMESIQKQSETTPASIDAPSKEQPLPTANRKICKIQDNPKRPSPEHVLFEICDELTSLNTKASGLYELLHSIQCAAENDQFECKDALSLLEDLSFGIMEKIQDLTAYAHNERFTR